MTNQEPETIILLQPKKNIQCIKNRLYIDEREVTYQQNHAKFITNVNQNFPKEIADLVDGNVSQIRQKVFYSNTAYTSKESRMDAYIFFDKLVNHRYYKNVYNSVIIQNSLILTILCFITPIYWFNFIYKLLTKNEVALDCERHKHQCLIINTNNEGHELVLLNLPHGYERDVGSKIVFNTKKENLKIAMTGPSRPTCSCSVEVPHLAFEDKTTKETFCFYHPFSQIIYNKYLF